MCHPHVIRNVVLHAMYAALLSTSHSAHSLTLLLCNAANTTGYGVGAQGPILSSLSASAGNATGLASEAFILGRQVALTCILSPYANVGLVTSTGWSFRNNSGDYGTDYLKRARKSCLTMIQRPVLHRPCSIGVPYVLHMYVRV